MNPSKYAPSRYGITDLMRRRFSPAGFSSAPVPSRDLLALLEAATWAPTEQGEYPGRYIVGIRDADDTHGRILAALPPDSRSWARRAPVLAIATIPAGSAVAHHDLGAATALMALEATARGLFVNSTHAVNVNAVRAAFAIPEPFLPCMALAVGYLAAPESLDAAMRARDTAPRSRPAPLEIAYSGRWGEGLAVNPDEDEAL